LKVPSKSPTAGQDDSTGAADIGGFDFAPGPGPEPSSSHGQASGRPSFANPYAGSPRRDSVDDAEQMPGSWKGYLFMLVGLVFMAMAVGQAVSPPDDGDLSDGRSGKAKLVAVLYDWLREHGGNGAAVAATGLVGSVFIASGYLGVRRKA
jgi:hypothetical protein